MAEEMRTCKTCGETKPLAAGFYKNRTDYDSKVYYRHDCKRCWDKAMGERNKQRVKKKKTETVAGEMRTCKTCGKTKPLEAGFNVIHRNGMKTYYYSSCKTCRNKEVKRKRLEKCAEKRAAEEATAREAEYGAMSGAMLHEHIRASHAACPILGIGLWTQSA
ncbi:hypothetical protein [Neisseria polysaccharea]|uniref:hypothetical protein n=1 Tax=Neisseria polysaccharea TaxID=489 RepID=UPI00272C1D8C|nr:hypothetical protein [Neisseria polysaccharea]